MLERNSASGTRRCRWGWALAGLAMLSGVPCHGEEPPVKLSILGVPDGQVKLSADTAAVALTLGVEASSKKDISATIRISPLRDAGGQLHPLKLSADSGLASQAADPGTRAELPIVIPAGRIVTFRVEATLAAAGEYTGDISFLHAGTRDTVRLLVMRAARELGVEIQGIHPLRPVAAVLGASDARLRVVLQETSGRPVTLDSPIVTEFSRREANGGRTQASQRLLMHDRDPGPLTLAANQSLPLIFDLAQLEGPGEYQGKLRIGARGAQPVDAEFAVTLRHPAWAAFLAILIGVGLSIALRFLGESLRPRLVEIRRAQWLMLEFERMRQESRSEPEDVAIVGSLHREVAATLLTLELGTMEQGTKERLDRLDERRKLASLWIYWRRRVAGLAPASLRVKFQPVIVSARTVVASEFSNGAQIERAREQLQELESLIDAELRRELTVRIETLCNGIADAVASRPGGALVAASGQLRERLDEARHQLDEGNLQAALGSYAEASTKWAELLLDDLAELVQAGAPRGIEPGRWASESAALHIQLERARAAIAEDLDRAVADYEEIWKRYTTLAGAGLRNELQALHDEAKNNQDLDREDRDSVLELIRQAQSDLTATLSAAGGIATQETLRQLSETERLVAKAASWLQPAKRGLDSTTAVPTLRLPIEVAPPLADDNADTRVITQADLRINHRRTRAVDAVVLVVTILVATLLGLITLWSPDATWGDWEDWIVALLWGLGLHQFTFAGVTNLRERLTGQRASVTVSS